MNRWTEREIRVPLYVPVRTDPALPNCWAVNLSVSGLGLVATRDAGGRAPTEGASMRIELALPDAGEPLRARAVVMWSYDTGGAVDGQPGVALGLRFVDLSGAARTALSRYFEAYRPQVAVLGADPEDLEEIRRALEPSAQLHLVSGEDELDDVLARGDVGAVLICGDDEARALRWLGRLEPGPDPGGTAPSSPARDLAPRVVYAAAAAPDTLVELFNSRRIFGVVRRPFERPQLEEVVLRACAEQGVRTEQHRVALSLERALARERARSRTGDGLDSVARRRVIGTSSQMAAVIEAAKVVAPHRVGVLLQGETGTGKEVMAHLIHELSDRADAAFVTQDCGALTETLLDSELFGHVKGAFTGATASHPGLFVLADGGTIFLDEIENTSPNLQAKLLRVIETGELRPVGGSKTRRVDVRVIAASNRDLRAAMEAGTFRADLYFRLTTFPITLPPLRERRDDILPLAEHFLALSVGGGEPAPRLSEEARRQLVAHDWPGNVRELRNVIERAALLRRPGAPIDVQISADGVRSAAPAPALVEGSTGAGSLDGRVADYEREMIRAALARHNGVVRRAAAELGVHPVTLGRKVRRYGLASRAQ